MNDHKLDESETNTINFSFRSEDSYELLVEGPAMIKIRPTFVPPLNLNDLPEYESSSSEGDPEPNQ